MAIKVRRIGSPSKDFKVLTLFEFFAMMRQFVDFPYNLFPGFKSRWAFQNGGIRMRGDQLARQWRIARAIEVSPGGLTVAELAQREEAAGKLFWR